MTKPIARRGALPVLVLTRTLLLAGVLLLLARLLLSAALLLTRLLGRVLGLLTRVILLPRLSLVWIAHSGSPLFHLNVVNGRPPSLVAGSRRFPPGSFGGGELSTLWRTEPQTNSVNAAAAALAAVAAPGSRC